MTDDSNLPRQKRFLYADYLIQTLRRRFEDVADSRRQNSTHFTMVDTLMAAFAMFSLKEPSLLSFEEREDEQAIDRLFGLSSIPSDSTMREILDGIDIEPLNEAFADIFFELQRSGELKKWVFDRGHYLAIEAIVKQDGETKNDCERNTTKRLLKRLRALHPKLKIIVVEDGLASNEPHIADLQAVNMRFLLGAKPGDHAHFFDQVIEAGDSDEGDRVSTSIVRRSFCINEAVDRVGGSRMKRSTRSRTRAITMTIITGTGKRRSIRHFRGKGKDGGFLEA